jgi:8-oxo-dGTP pyrophosphatase MutT (NUDIX family)
MLKRVKLPVTLTNDNVVHQYCIRCQAETVDRILRDNRTFYHCRTCGTTSDRSIVIDPGIVWWIDKHSGEYWHESVGTVVTDGHGRMLLFRRTIFPFADTIPAGHLDTGEQPRMAAVRELKEEAGIEVPEVHLVLITEEDVNEPCRRGSDHHRWHLYRTTVNPNVELKQNDEGQELRWVDFEQVDKLKLVTPLAHFVGKFGRSLLD